jgi:hypothetical protein
MRYRIFKQLWVELMYYVKRGNWRWALLTLKDFWWVITA